MSMNRAYSTMELKVVDEANGKRRFTGIASTINADRAQDIVEPKGMTAKLPVPLLWQHDHSRPIGWVTATRVSAKQIEVDCEMAIIEEPGALKDRLDEAWQSIKSKLVRGLSIGFDPAEYVRIDGTYGYRYTAWELLELSAVTIPMNADCSITTIKSIDQQQRAASGNASARGVVRLNKAPVAGAGKTNAQEGNMNVQEQIKAFEAQRAEKAARMSAIMAKSAEAGETLDAEQEGEYDGLKTEVATIDKHLERLREHEKAVAARAVPVVNNNSGAGADGEEARKAAAAARTGSNVIAVARKDAPGVAFARLAGVMAASKGSLSDAIMFAKNRFPEEKPLHSVLGAFERIKAAVDVGTTLDSDYAAPLVQYQTMANEFIEWLRPQTIIGKIPNLRRVPFNIQVPRQTSGGGAAWVGEAAPKPATATAFDMVTLRNLKLAALAVISKELARFSQPSAELIIRDTLAGAVIQQMDSDFVNPANAGTSNIKPASVTNGVAGIPSSGNLEANVREDIQAVFAPFIAANLTPVNGVWLMSATTALAISLMVNNLGQPAFPGVTMTGGIFQGMPVVVSEAVGNIVVLLNAQDILLADDGQVTIDVSDQASVQMDSAPTNPPVAATVFISLWQMNLLGILAERHVNWVKGRAAAVQYLSGVNWGQPVT